ncbi:MAG: aldehyde ferredoxin oxidoreductase C-terminal domain-containing protein, partial [Desulforhabdus sp.]|nr:aldehyde ferredoxin oxidoreductase C-terminal domain-containing protein [Desulforhabdus sp.]
TLPFRYFEPMPVGRYKGEKIEPQMLDLMLDEYYQLHGWDQATGIPLRDVLRDLELDFAVPEAD